MRQYLRNLFISLDQLINTLLGGDPDETLSSRAAKSPDLPHWKYLARFLEWIDPGHMARSVERDEGRDALIR